MKQAGIGPSRRTKRLWVGHTAQKARASRPVQTAATTANAARRGLRRNRARARPAHRPASGAPVDSSSQKGRLGQLAQLTAPRDRDLHSKRRDLHQVREGKQPTHRALQREGLRLRPKKLRAVVLCQRDGARSLAAWAKAVAQPQPASRSARATAVRMRRAPKSCSRNLPRHRGAEAASRRESIRSRLGPRCEGPPVSPPTRC